MTGTDAPRSPRLSTSATIGLPVLGLVGAVAVWWLAIVVFSIESFLVPTPLEVAKALVNEAGYLRHNTWVTLEEVLLGFGLAVATALVIGIVLASSRVIELALYPVLVVLNAIPKLSLAVLLVVWMGFGQAPKVVMVVIMCFFPVVLATVTGLTSTPADLAELARSLSASRWQTFVKVRLKSALPQIFVGLKTAMPLAVIGAFIGEMFGATAGLGFVIQNSGTDIARCFAAIVLLSVMTVLLFYAVVILERLLVPWMKETTG